MSSVLDFVFVNPPSPFLTDQLVMPPVGIMTLSAFLKSKGFSVAIHDMSTNEPEYDFDVPLAKYTGITATTPQYPYALDVLNAMKNDGKHDGTTYIIGGPHASCFGGCLEDGFDVMVIGEGEEVLAHADYLVAGQVINGIPIENLDDLPFPDRQWPGFKRYKYLHSGLRFVTSATSRGCPYRCGFCYSMFGKRARFMSVGRVLEEAKTLKEMGFQGVQYNDDTFTAKRERALEISRGVKALGLSSRLFVRANTTDADMIAEFKENGCVEIGVGVESGSDQILHNITKGTTAQQCRDVVEMCHSVGLLVKTFLIVGLPGETWETVEATKAFIREAKPDDYDISIYTPFPKTPIWKSIMANDGIDLQIKDVADFGHMFYKSFGGCYRATVRTAELSYEDIEKARDEIDAMKGEY